MNDERNLIFDVCVFCVNETIFFFEGENKSKKTHSSFFLSFLFFFTRELFEFFFSNIKRTPLKCSKFLTRYISFSTGNKLSSALKTREHRFSPSKEGCVGTLSSVDNPSFEQNT